LFRNIITQIGSLLFRIYISFNTELWFGHFAYAGCDRQEVYFLAHFQGAGAFEVAARQHLINEVKKTVQGVI
jgi:hypothetical protein